MDTTTTIGRIPPAEDAFPLPINEDTVVFLAAIHVAMCLVGKAGQWAFREALGLVEALTHDQRRELVMEGWKAMTQHMPTEGTA